MASFSRGTSFTDGVTGDVTAAKLHALVDAATPVAGLVTDRTAETSVASGDQVLIADASDSNALKKMTVTNLFKTDVSITSGTGTAGTVAIGPTGDTNTGLFFPAADTIAFSEGGTESMRIDSSGNVGIGTTSPVKSLHILNPTAAVGSAQLELEGQHSGYGAGINFSSRTSSGGTLVSMAKITADGEDVWNTTGTTQDAGLRFSTTQNGTLSERLRIDSSGNVGIGTTSPDALLDVKRVNTDGLIAEFGSGDLAGDVALEIKSSDSRASINIGANGGTGDASRNLVFSTSGTERLRIDSSGRVGIGTTGPQKELQINATEPTIRLEESGVGAKRLELSVNSAAEAKIFANQSGGQLLFGTVGTERLRVDSSGNLLAGTTDTAYTTGVGFKIHASSTVPDAAFVINTATSNVGNYYLYNTNATNNGYRFYVTANGGITNWSANNVNLSDVRLKTDIQNAGNYLEKICSIPVKTFLYKDQGDDTERTIGVIAQEVESIIPELINNDGFGETPEDGIPLKTIYQTDFQYVLMRCIQEQQVIINELKTKVAALEAA